MKHFQASHLRSALLWIVAATLLLCLPLMFHWDPAQKSSDLNIYLITFEAFSKQFWSGDVYPRWLHDVNDGLGGPVFIYYGPLSGYLFSAFAWLQNFDPIGYYRLTACFAIMVFASGWLCYAWLKFRLNDRLALAIALFYTVMPYKIVVIYVQHSMPQVIGHCMMLLILYACERILHQKRYGYALFTVGFSLLILAHPPTVLVFCWVPFLYLLLLSPAATRLRHLMVAAGAGMLSLLLTAFYWIPLWLNRAFVHLDVYTGSHRDFVGSYFRHFNDFVMPLYLPVFVLFVWALRFAKPMLLDEEKRFVTFLLCVTVVLLIMVTPLSAPIVALFPVLEYLQFPLRYYNLMILPIACMAGFLLIVYHFKRSIVYFWMVLFVAHLFVIFVFTEKQDDGTFEQVRSYRHLYATEYCPITTPQEFCSLAALQKHYERMAPVMVRSGSAISVHTAKDEWPIRTNISVMSTSADIVFRHRYFPGIRVTNVENGQVLPIEPSVPDGLVQLRLPKGQYQLMLSFGSPYGSDKANLLSLLGILAFMGLLWFERRNTTRMKTVY